MAGDRGGRKRKRRKGDKRKLLPGEKVEVLHTDEGLNGSWHSGHVIDCGERFRLVEYTDLRSEDDSSNLVESIVVSAAVDGLTGRTPRNYRGQIRPPPPTSEFQKSAIRYGLCVDALVDDAWWEGVVFDHKGGSSERLVFFPDQGDQQMITIDKLRLTREWNESSGHWKSRGEWLLLQVLQTFEQENVLPVSTREIWYDLRTTTDFIEKIGMWTFGSVSVWHSLVSELIQELQSVAHGVFFARPVSSNQLLDVPLILSAVRTPTHVVDLRKDGARLHDVLSVKDFRCSKLQTANGNCSSDRLRMGECANENYPEEATQNKIAEISRGGICSEGVLSLSCWDNPNKKQRLCSQSGFVAESYHTDVCLPSHLRELSNVNSHIAKSCTCVSRKFNDGDCASRLNYHLTWKDHGAEADSRLVWEKKVDGRTDVRATNSWQPLGIKAMYCHEAIKLCAYGSEDRACRPKRLAGTDHNTSDARLKAKQHLSALGWKIEARKDDKARLRVRLLSPDGHCYHSLHKACRGLLMGHQKQDHKSRNHENTDEGHLSSNTCDLFQAKFSSEPTYVWQDCPLMKKNCQRDYPSEIAQMSIGNEHAKLERSSPQKFRIFLKMTNANDLSNSKDLSHSGLEHLHTSNNYITTAKDKTVPSLSEEGFPMREDFEPDYSLGAVLQYKKYIDSMKGKGQQDSSNADLSTTRLNAKKHLKLMGWRLSMKVQKTKNEWLYASPEGKSYRSLYSACDAYLAEQKNLKSNRTRSVACIDTSKRTQDQSISKKFEDSVGKNPLYTLYDPFTTVSSSEFWDATDASAMGAEEESMMLSKFSDVRKDGHRKLKDSSLISPFSLFQHAVLGDKPLKKVTCHSSIHKKQKKGKTCQILVRQGHKIGSLISPGVSCSRKRSRQTAQRTPGKHVARTVLSLLIDNDMILPRQKVQYIRKKDGHVMMEGRITRDGIKCNCCKKVYSLINFEAHAGSSKRRPSANIFLQDGRSLLQCQMQMVHNKKSEGFQHPRLKSDYSLIKSDGICSVCHDGGSLVLCDHCPSSFHLGCVGLEDIPKERWFCPSCRCGICGSSEFNSDAEQFTEKTILYCDQCEREYHVGCLRKHGSAKLRSCPVGNWFCSKRCSKIFLHLQKLLGKSKQTTEEGLSWTILRSNKQSSVDCQQFDAETIAEHDSKLCMALDVLHECFVTIIEPRTRSDLVADLLFNKESELDRLNFYGFYTMLLERGDELISVATFRVYGEKVAEVPLVATRVKYRRQGMCRLLMNELEKLLSSLGVERLMLPAVPQLLETWTTSFGFSRLSTSDRSKILEYTLLNFQGTTMCQKLLIRDPTELGKSKGGYKELTVRSSKSLEEVDSETHNIVSEVVEMDPISTLPSLGTKMCPLPPEVDTLEQISSVSTCTDLVEMKNQMPNVPAKCNDNSIPVETSSIVMVTPSTDYNCKLSERYYQCIGETGSNNRHLIHGIHNRNVGTFKYFYSRRISAGKQPCLLV